MKKNHITLLNNTPFTAQYVVKKGDQIIARIPGIESNAIMAIPTEETYEVIATTVIDGNTYTSAPQTVHNSMGFLAQVLQVKAQGTYEFDVLEIANSVPNTLAFQKTCLGPVTFTITKNSLPLQNVVVPDSNMTQTLDISDTFYVYAVVNGVTTATTEFTKPTSVVTAMMGNSNLESGYAWLEVN
jgi:hypothetical protein